MTLAKVGDFASPVYVTAPLGDTSRVFVVQQAGTIALVKGGATSTFLDITSKVAVRRRARPALDGLRAWTTRRAACSTSITRRSSPTRPDHHRGAPRRPREPRQGGPVLRAPAGHHPARPAGQPQRRPAAVRPRRGRSTPAPATAAAAATRAATARTRRWHRRRCDTADSVNHDYRLGKLLRIDPATGAVLDLRLRPAQPVALLLRPHDRRPHHRRRRPGPLRGDRLRRGARRRRGRQLRLEHLRGPAHVPRQRWRRAARRARSLPVIEYPHGPACSITGGYVVRDPALPELAGTYLYGDNCTGDITGATLPAGHHARAGPQRPERVELRRGRLRARLRGLARRAPSTASPSSGACAGPAPFVGRLPAGVAGGPSAAGPDRRAPAFTLLRAAARQHALRTGFVADPRALRRAVHRERERPRAHQRAARTPRPRRSCARAPRGRRSWPARARPCA